MCVSQGIPAHTVKQMFLGHRLACQQPGDGRGVQCSMMEAAVQRPLLHLRAASCQHNLPQSSCPCSLPLAQRHSPALQPPAIRTRNDDQLCQVSAACQAAGASQCGKVRAVRDPESYQAGVAGGSREMPMAQLDAHPGQSTPTCPPTLPDISSCKLTTCQSLQSRSSTGATAPTSSAASTSLSLQPSEPLPKMTQACSPRRARAPRNSMLHISKEFLEQHGFFNMPLEVFFVLCVALPSKFLIHKQAATKLWLDLGM